MVVVVVVAAETAAAILARPRKQRRQFPGSSVSHFPHPPPASLCRERNQWKQGGGNSRGPQGNLKAAKAVAKRGPSPLLGGRGVVRTPPRTQVRRGRQDGGRSTVPPPLTGDCARNFLPPPPLPPSRVAARAPSAVAPGRCARLSARAHRDRLKWGHAGRYWAGARLFSPPSRLRTRARVNERALKERTQA